ncbi:MAG: hypothetical protein JXQ75_00770 [Phycisphaerae bacterium]|nr:hypothetical protein [Phycisphaerae bacterium]
MSRDGRKACGLVLLVAFMSSGMGCPALEGLPFAGGDAGAASALGTLIMLRIVNESGVDAIVEATFHIDDSEVRKTTRSLAADGVEATELVVPTSTSRIHLVAREAEPTAQAARVGDTLVDAEIPVGPEVKPGDTITFTIRPHDWPDCNDNGIDDDVEIADDTAADCNENGIPDECDIAAEFSDDCNENGIPDECDIAAGTSRDCNMNDVPDECESPAPVALVVVEQAGGHDRILLGNPYGSSFVLVDLGDAGLGSVKDVAVDIPGARAFFTESTGPTDGTIHSARLADGSLTELVSGLRDVGGIALDLPGGKTYWGATGASPGIFRANLDGTGIEEVLADLPAGMTKPLVDASGQQVYFITRFSGDSIKRADVDGTDVETVVAGLVAPSDIDLWSHVDLLVWADRHPGGGVFKASLNGSGAARIAAEPTVTGVAIDREGCKIYWAAEGSGVGFVARADFDGSNRETVLSGLDHPLDIAIYRLPQGAL